MPNPSQSPIVDVKLMLKHTDATQLPKEKLLSIYSLLIDALRMV
jgi:hypothetical protein